MRTAFLMSLFFLFQRAGGQTACLTPDQMKARYQNVLENPFPAKRDVDQFLKEYSAALAACPSKEKTYLKALEASDLGQAQEKLVGHWKREKARAENTGPTPEKKALSALPNSTCSAVDLRSKLPPLKLQGGTQLCASFMTADLLSMDLGKEVSPLSLALGVGKYRVGESPDDDAVRKNAGTGVSNLAQPLRVAAGEVGFCYESDFPSNWKDVIETGDVSDILRSVQELGWGSMPKENVCNQTTTSMRRLFPSAKPEDLKEIYKHSQGQLLLTKFNQCRKTLPKGELEKFSNIRFRMDADEDLKKKVLDQALNKGEMVGSVLSSQLLASKEEASADPNHAIGIVGRRQNPKTGECEYMVRDSLGPKTNHLDPSYTKESEGHIWIPQTVLLKSLDEMVFKK